MAPPSEIEGMAVSGRGGRCRRSGPVVGVIAAALAIVFVTPAGALAEDPFDARIRHAAEFAQERLARTAGSLPSTAYPQTTGPGGGWRTTGPGAWTSGFLPGNFWLAHQYDARRGMGSRGKTWQAGVDGQRHNTSTHDVGFMVSNSFGNAYRLTGDPRYGRVVLDAASALATRYSPKVGAIRSWNTSDFTVIVDNMMNLELLFRAARSGGDPRWRAMAIRHALRTRADHVRRDGSTYHVVDYDPATGAVRRRRTKQGAADESTWSRGQAWAVHGFTMAYRESGDERFLRTARRTADYFIAHLPPDGIPYWDFQAPGIPREPRDSSAAAIAASGLLELAVREPDRARAARYLAAARRMLFALASSRYLAEGTSNRAVLRHGTYSKPHGRFNTGLVWGDYYFLEALLRLRRIATDAQELSVAAVRGSAHRPSVADDTVDGSLATRWEAAGDGQWIEYDLGSPREIAKVAVAFHQGNRRASRFDLQVSDDRSSWQTVASPISSAATTRRETYDFADVRGRYLRVVGHGNSRDASNAITEVEPYSAGR